MKAAILSALVIVMAGMLSDASAQIRTSNKMMSKIGDYKFAPMPHKCQRHNWNTSIRIQFDAASTVLTVTFPSNSHGGTVEVFRNGTKVAGVTANSGTTFSCKLRDYGAGNYNVIVSSGNTVIDSKNFTVR